LASQNTTKTNKHHCNHDVHGRTVRDPKNSHHQLHHPRQGKLPFFIPVNCSALDFGTSDEIAPVIDIAFTKLFLGFRGSNSQIFVGVFLQSHAQLSAF
jgi:hypothetical protein